MRPSAAVLLLAAGALASACGGGSTATHSGPLDAPDCSTAVTLTTAGSGSSAVTVAETTDGQWFCVSGDPIGLDTSPGSVSTPTLTDAGSLPNGGVFYLYVLASDTPTGVTLRDETGADVAVAQARDGDHLLVLDLDADAQMMGRNEVERRWQLVGTDGAVLLTLHCPRARRRLGPGHLRRRARLPRRPGDCSHGPAALQPRGRSSGLVGLQ